MLSACKIRPSGIFQTATFLESLLGFSVTPC